MSKLRDEIERVIIENVWTEGEWGEYETHINADKSADAILALVRDAMLSDAAVEAAEGESWMDDMRTYITAALDAAGITEDK